MTFRPPLQEEQVGQKLPMVGQVIAHFCMLGLPELSSLIIRESLYKRKKKSYAPLLSNSFPEVHKKVQG